MVVSNSSKETFTFIHNFKLLWVLINVYRFHSFLHDIITAFFLLVKIVGLH